MIGIYAGSFDVLTYGHIDIMQRSAYMFPETHVLVANNSSKDCLFTPDERLDMIEKCVDLAKLNISAYIYDDLVALACEGQKRVLVRGVRDYTDIAAELSLAEKNKMISGINTILLPAQNQYRTLSSSFVKELLHYGRNIHGLVPPYVVQKLKDKGKI